MSSHRVSAEISFDKSATSSSKSPCIVKIYNASSKILSYVVKDNTLLLRGSYESAVKTTSDMPLLFAGQIIKSSTRREGSDQVTTITCGDSIYARNNIKVSGSLPNGTTYLQAIKNLTDILKTKGIPVQNIDIYSEQADRILSTLPNGFSYEGTLVDVLNKLTASIRYRTYFHLGKLYIEPVENPFYSDAIRIKPENIKGSISPSDDTSGKSAKDGDSKTGIEFNTFLNGEITLNKVLIIDGIENYTGTYKITGLEHKMDSEGNKWDSIVTARRI